MDWVYKPSGGVVGLARKAGELYGGTVRLETFAGGVVRCYFEDLHWFTFRFHSEEAGLSALYPVHGIEWGLWGEDYIFRNADVVRDRIINAGSVTDAERDNRANQEIANFLDKHLSEVRERPVQKYELVREGAMWRLEPLVYMGTWRGGLVDGPAVVPHHGKAWVGGSSRVEGVRLGANAEVLYSYRARAHESDASELMMYQDLVPGLAAAVLMIKNEGEREKEKDNGKDNGKDNEEA